MKTIIVTGASSGIGRATAFLLLENGFRVIGTYAHNETAAAGLKEDQPNIEVYKVDFSVRSETLQFLSGLQDTEIHGLVNNAGIFEEDNNSIFGDTLDLDIWDKTLEINTTAPLMLAQALMQRMPAGSAIVNVASVDAYFAAYASYSYAASKSALINLTKSLAVNTASRRIRVNAVAPGWIDTSMGAEAGGVTQDAINKTPLGRNGKPEEVAELIVFLLSDKASFITGEIISIDGGYSIVDEVLQKEAKNLLAS